MPFSIPNQSVQVFIVKFTLRMLPQVGSPPEYVLRFEVTLPTDGYLPGTSETDFINLATNFAKNMGNAIDGIYAGTVEVRREFLGADGAAYGGSVV
jgi:hypothetical protein